MKTKTPKPRVMWANYYSKSVCFHPKESDAVACRSEFATTIRVAVIPLSDTEAIVERAAKAMCNRKDDETWGNLHWDNQEIYRDAVSAALTAAGIPCRKASK